MRCVVVSRGGGGYPTRRCSTAVAGAPGGAAAAAYPGMSECDVWACGAGPERAAEG
jgi:hypothetical protein